MSLTVVIPSRALTGLLRQCLSSLQDAAVFAGIDGMRVVVVDNASPVPYRRAELTTDLDLELLRFDTPRSFSRACNAGARLGDGAAPLLFLNNDVLLHRRALLDLCSTAQTYRAGVCGARLVYPDDTIQHCGVLFDSGERGPYHHLHWVPSHLVPRRPRVLQAVTGACFLVERPLFDQLGGFDEQFPFAYEDIDFCLRARQAGATIVCAQAVDSIHLQGSSRDERAYALERQSRALFFARWRGRFNIDGSADDR